MSVNWRKTNKNAVTIYFNKKILAKKQENIQTYDPTENKYTS